MAAVPVPTSAAPRRRSAPLVGRARRPRLELVGPPRHARRYVVLVVLTAAAGIFGTVSLNALAAEQSFAVRSLEREVSELSQRYEELTAEVASLAAPSRVRDVAAVQLGMVPASDPGYLRPARAISSDGDSERADWLLSASTSTPGGGMADPLKPVLSVGR